MNQDFQRFVASVGESVTKKYGSSTTTNIPITDILALPLVDKPNATVEQALGDIVASIRWVVELKALGWSIVNNFWSPQQITQRNYCRQESFHCCSSISQWCADLIRSQ
jgi:hypothetical protein